MQKGMQIFSLLANSLSALASSFQKGGRNIAGFSLILNKNSPCQKLVEAKPVFGVFPSRRKFISGILAGAAAFQAASSAGAAECIDGGASTCPRYLSQEEAVRIDEELMATPGFSVDQLMELAGLSCAAALHKAFSDKRRVLIVCGPGNNGGDGLVAARHLYHFGYQPTIVYPRQSSQQLFVNLVHQVTDLGIPVLSSFPEDFQERYDVVMDAIFGFSFKGKPRDPFGAIIEKFATSAIPVVSVDIPSGWDVELGDVNQSGFMPQVLVSLTSPKKSAQFFEGRHFLGGRFVPPGLASRYGLPNPGYVGADQIVELPKQPKEYADKLSQTLTSSDEFTVAWITAPNEEAAKSLAGKLVENRLAACVNMVPGIQSVYSWKGKIEQDSEVLMMVKTRKALMKELTEFVAKEHPYQVPETIAAQLIGGNSAYFDWLKDNTKS